MNLTKRDLLYGGVTSATTLVALGLAVPVQAQGVFSHGTVIALQGTPHLWIAGDQGVLHWAGDTRALADVEFLY